MKKIVYSLIIAITSFLTVNAQKENGIVYSEHEAIAKTKALRAAFVNGDKDGFISFFSDSVWVDMNGDFKKIPKKNLGEAVDWWKNFEKLSIEDDKPAFPDAINYKNGGLWVQDWLLWKGIHSATGIKLKLRIHILYSFDKNGKISSIHEYFNNDIFEMIEKSQRTIESGIIYKYHPYINIIRKVVNAYCAKDMETLASFYAPDAVFGSLSLKDGEAIDSNTQKANTQKTF
jgi:hypothetical protein